MPTAADTAPPRTVRSPRAGELVAVLREEILAGQLPAGRRLPEVELAARFGAGRGVVREALRELAGQGLIVVRPNCGASVAPEPTREAREVLAALRRTLEAFALRQIFDRLDEADFRRWEELLGRMETACRKRDYPTIAETDLAFHRSLLERADAPDLLAVWETIAHRVRTHFRRTQRRFDDPLAIYEEHRRIVERIRTGPASAAVKFLVENID